MRVIGFDTETTGLDPEAGERIIEIALLTYDLESQELLDTYIQRFDPEKPITTKAQEVHGITYESLVGCPKFGSEIEEITRRLAAADLVVAHNLEFDAKFLLAEYRRAKQPLPSIEGFDTLQSRWACFDGKFPKLGELAFALNVPYDPSKAHGAQYDTSIMMECFFRGLARGFYTLPQTLELRKAA